MSELPVFDDIAVCKFFLSISSNIDYWVMITFFYDLY